MKWAKVQNEDKLNHCYMIRGMEGTSAVAEFYYKTLNSVYFVELNDRTVLIWSNLRHGLRREPTLIDWDILAGRIGENISGNQDIWRFLTS